MHRCPCEHGFAGHTESHQQASRHPGIQDEDSSVCGRNRTLRWSHPARTADCRMLHSAKRHATRKVHERCFVCLRV
jgi:hypothetical protein